MTRAISHVGDRVSLRAHLTSAPWITWPCAALGVGLCCFSIASLRRRTKTCEATKSAGGMPSDDIIPVGTPHPEWVPGLEQSPPEKLGEDHVPLDPLDCTSCYPLMISAVVPRPIGFVSTKAVDGTVNLAPFSYFNTVGHDPPMLVISVCRKGGDVKKDTLTNIEDTGEFVVSIISEWFVEAANHTCGNFPPEVDEMEVAGLTPLESIIVSPPRVKESAVNMECKVRHTYDIVNHMGESTTTVVFGEVVMFHVLPHLLDEAGAGHGKPTIKLEGYKPMARLGGNTYGRLGSVFELRRPSVK